MTSFLERWSRIDSALGAALELPVDRREEFLAQLEGQDPEARRQLERLLRLADDGQSTLESGAAALLELAPEPDGQQDPDGDPWLGRRLGRYRLERRIGSGGMASVYLAARADGLFDQQVALKIVRPDRPSEAVLQRFHHERRILASLEHPHIARLFDGGTTEEGLPYLVMEFVEGEPITVHGQARRLDVDARLELFVTVCAAVQAAHQALVVHRDLKPSNILVTPDGDVKLLDFGIAKVLVSDDEDLTSPGERPMTPAYASPEQIVGEPVTAASDVFALGVLLFEMLSDQAPFPADGHPLETMRAVLQDTPPPASEVAPSRRRRRLRGDLDAIIAKALAKEPASRYGSAAELARDVERHRLHRTVEARPAGWLRRVGKLLRRQRLALGIFVSAATALAALLAAHTGRLAAERDFAERSAADAQAVQGFVVDLFALADPDKIAAGELPAFELLEAGRAQLAELDLQPSVQAELQTVLGELYGRLGRLETAAELLTSAVASRRQHAGGVELSASLYELGVIHRLAGRLDESDAVHGESLELRRAMRPADEWLVAQSTNELGLVAWARGDAIAAEALHRETLARRRTVIAERGDPSLDLTSSLNNLALALRDQGRADEALPLLEELLVRRRERHGEPHSRVATALGNLALVYSSLGRQAEAEPLFLEALAQVRQLFGDDHPKMASALLNVAGNLRDLGRL
ncbi:MAG: serine/threonine-protein kinase, partial [Acidobacteriota bacterium]